MSLLSFYSEKNLKKTMEELKKYVGKDLSLQELWDFKDLVNGLANSLRTTEVFTITSTVKRYVMKESTTYMAIL